MKAGSGGMRRETVARGIAINSVIQRNVRDRLMDSN